MPVKEKEVNRTGKDKLSGSGADLDSFERKGEKAESGRECLRGLDYLAKPGPAQWRASTACWFCLLRADVEGP